MLTQHERGVSVLKLNPTVSDSPRIRIKTDPVVELSYKVIYYAIIA